MTREEALKQKFEEWLATLSWPFSWKGPLLKSFLAGADAQMSLAARQASDDAVNIDHLPGPYWGGEPSSVSGDLTDPTTPELGGEGG